MRFLTVAVILSIVGCSAQSEKTYTNSRTKSSEQANDPSSENAKAKGEGTPDSDGFTLTENLLITSIANALNMKPEEIALLRNLLAKDHAAIKPLADLIGKLTSKEVAAFVKGKFVEMSVHDNILAKVSYLLGHTNADKLPAKSLRIESDGVVEGGVTSIITGEFVGFRAIAIYADASERDITNFVLWKLDSGAADVTQDKLSPYRLKGEKDGAAGKFSATLQIASGDLIASVSYSSRKSISQSYSMHVEKNGEQKINLPLGLYFKVKVVANVVDFGGKTIATLDKSDSTVVTMTQSGTDPHVVRSTVFGSPVYRSFSEGIQNFKAQIDGQQLSAALTITPAVELFKYISGSEDYVNFPFEECGSILKNDDEKASVSVDGGWVQLVGDSTNLALYSVLSTCEWEQIENVKFLPADVYVPTETPGNFILGKARSLDQVGSITTADGQPIATLNKLASDVRAKQLTALVFSENLAANLTCMGGDISPDKMTDGKMSGAITKNLYAVFNECRVEAFDTSDTGIFEVTGMNPANIISVSALNFGQIEFAPNPARGSLEQTVDVTMSTNLGSLCYSADSLCIASSQRNVTQSVIVPGAVPADISFSENGLSCTFEQGKSIAEPEIVQPGQALSLSLFFSPYGTDSNGNCLAIPFSDAMKASTQLETSANVTLTGWTLTAPAEGDFQITAHYTGGNDMLTATRYFVVESSPSSNYENVRPIFEARCQSCHIQTAPNLGTFQNIVTHRSAILQTLLAGQMPPNAADLPQHEKQLLVTFLEGLSGGDGGSSSSSDLNIKQTREDVRHTVQVNLIKDGNVVKTETFDSPGRDKSVILRDFCSQTSTCLRVTFIGSITQEAGSAECVFLAPQSDNTVKIDVDVNGSGFLGACKPDEDETYFFSCPESTGILKVAECAN